jgi:putative DNA primase/helicase
MSFRCGKSGADDVGCNVRRAAELWQEALPTADTIVALYFAKRGLARLLADIDETALRYHPCCPFGSARLPCLLALMRDVRTNEPRAIQRTAIDKSGDKIGRMSLGPKSGAAIKLSANEHVTMGLAIGEGLETVLSAMQMGFRPAWALGDANNLGAFPVLSGIESLTILVDNDESGTGQRRALECSRRWTKAGREVFHALPDHVGDDFNDVLRWSFSS